MQKNRREVRRLLDARRRTGATLATSALALAALAGASGSATAAPAPLPFPAALSPAAFTGFPVPAAAADDTPADWAVAGTTARMQLAFTPPAGLATPLTDFPVLVRLTPERIDYARTAANNLFFVDPADPSSRLPYQVEKWDPTGESLVWVKAPQIASDADKLWLYYGGSDVSSVDPQAVWDSASAAVYHFDDASSLLKDATGKTAAGTVRGDPVLATGEVGSAIRLDGVDDNGNLGFPGDGAQSTTYSAWLNVTPEMLSSSAGYAAVLARDIYGGSRPGEVMFLGMYQGRLLTRVVVGGTIKEMRGDISAGWHQISVTYDGTAGHVYVDGVQAGSAAATGVLGSVGEVPMTLGSYSNNNGYFPMTVDEARIVTTARSADWLRAEYLASADRLLSYGLSETIGGAMAMQLTGPTAGQQLDASTIHLTGLMSKTGTVVYRLDGGAGVTVAHTGTSFDAAISGLRTGSHTVEVTATADGDATDTITRSVTFQVVGTAAPAAASDPAPADGAELSGTSAQLSVKVEDPTGDPLDVSFHALADHTLTGTASAGTLDAAPTTSVQPAGGAAFGSDDVRAAQRTDGSYATTRSDSSGVFQTYEVPVGDVAAGQSTVAVHWRGHADHTVTLFGWNYQLGRWTAVGSGFAADGRDFDITADASTTAMVKNGNVRLLAYRGTPLNPLTARIPRAGDFDFSFAWMSDTQFYTQSYPDYYTAISQDVVDQRAARNTQYAFHLGDIVETWNDENMWRNADASMKVLEDANIPYGVLPGNHDNGSAGDAAHHTLYSKYFGRSRFASKPWFGGDYNDNQDHYDLMTVGGIDFIMLYVGYAVDDDELAWARDVLARYPQRRAIVAMHDYQKPGNGALSTDAADPQKLYDGLISQSPNIFLTISGHLHGAGFRVEKFGDRTVTQIEVDYQNGPLGGGGYYRYLQFDTQNGLLYVNTYSPVTRQTQFFGDAADTLVFKMPELLVPSTRSLSTDSVGVTTAGSEIGRADDVASGARASMTLDGLTAGMRQGWFATVTDPSGNVVRSDTWTFTTPGGDDGGDQNPGGGDQNPGGGDQNPGGGDQNPGGGDQNPGGGNQNPGGGGNPAPVDPNAGGQQPPTSPNGPLGGTTPVDRTAPKASGLKLVGKAAVHGSAQFALNLSEPAQVRIALTRAVAGRKVGKACKAPSKRSAHAKPCTRWVAAGTFSKQLAAGRAALKVALANKPAGSYRATLTLRDAAGNVSRAQTLRFTVAKAAKKKR